MTPSHTSKGGKRYRYYVTHPGALLAAGAIAWRISAPEAERIVVDRLKGWLSDRGATLIMAGAGAAALAFAKAQQAATDLNRLDRCLPLIEQLVGRIDIGQGCITLTLNPTGVQQLLWVDQLPIDDPIRLTAHTIRIRQGKDVRLIVRDAQDRSANVASAQPSCCVSRCSCPISRRVALLAPSSPPLQPKPCSTPIC